MATLRIGEVCSDGKTHLMIRFSGVDFSQSAVVERLEKKNIFATMGVNLMNGKILLVPVIDGFDVFLYKKIITDVVMETYKHCLQNPLPF